jgi:hypothetical protein
MSEEFITRPKQQKTTHDRDINAARYILGAGRNPIHFWRGEVRVCARGTAW